MSDPKVTVTLDPPSLPGSGSTVVTIVATDPDATTIFLEGVAHKKNADKPFTASLILNDIPTIEVFDPSVGTFINIDSQPGSWTATWVIP